jgi:hypothetical protein
MGRLDLGALVGNQTMREPSFSNPYSETVYKFMNKQYDVKKEASDRILAYDDREKLYAAKAREEARLLQDREKKANTGRVIEALMSGRISSPDQLGISNYDAKTVADYMENVRVHDANINHNNFLESMSMSKFQFTKDKYNKMLSDQEARRREAIAASNSSKQANAEAKAKVSHINDSALRIAGSTDARYIQESLKDAASVGDVESVAILEKALQLSKQLPKTTRATGIPTIEEQMVEADTRWSKAPTKVKDIFNSDDTTDKVDNILSSLNLTTGKEDLANKFRKRFDPKGYVEKVFFKHRKDNKLNHRIFDEKIAPFVGNVLNGDTDRTTLGNDYDKYLEAIKLLKKSK